jgi:hypothetical protein
VRPTSIALLPEIGSLDCLACETRRRRAATDILDPTVWYDTSLRDWVVRLPAGGCGIGAVLPLDLPWFDVPRAFIYRAAAELVYAGERVDGLTEDAQRNMDRRRPDIRSESDD